MELILKLINDKGFKWKRTSNKNGTETYFYKSIRDLSHEELQKSNCDVFVSIKCTTDEVNIKSDNFRTIPIFYTISEGTVTISDSVESLIDYEENRGTLIKEMKDLYLGAGFTPKYFTVFDNIWQTRASETVNINIHNGKVNHLMTGIYTGNSEPEELDFNNFKKIIQDLSKEMKMILKDYTIYLPLSDGFDSLLIACILKNNSFENIKCFSYGDEQSVVAERSRYIADLLGFEWFFCSYSKKEWEQVRKSDEFKKYLDFSGQGSNFTHFQDFLAVKKISEKLSSKERENAIFIPGHTGTIGGGNLDSKEIEKVNSFSDLVNLIIKKDFSLNRSSKKTKELIGKIVKQDFFNSDLNKKNIIDFLQTWDIKERQSKNIINSLRVYEFFDMKWYLPLQNTKLIEGFYNIKYINKLDKRKYKEFISRLAYDFGVSISPAKKNRSCVRKLLKEVFLRPYQFIYHKFEVINHQFLWFSLFSFKELIYYICINSKGFPSMISKVYINSLENSYEYKK